MSGAVTIESDNAGNKTQFEFFYRRECQALYRYVYVWVGNPECATEIVQESFLNLYQMQSGKESPVYERTLLFRVARNQIVDLLRRHSREGDTGEATIGGLVASRPACESVPEERLSQEERRRNATAAFERLSSQDQECLALRRSGLSYQAVAEIMNIDQNSVSQATIQALRKFEEAYDALVRGEGHR